MVILNSRHELGALFVCQYRHVINYITSAIREEEEEEEEYRNCVEYCVGSCGH